MTQTHLLPTANGTFNIALDGPSDAPALLFSNSLGTTLEMWQGQAEYFADYYRIIRYDTRGHGSSEVPEGPYSIADLGSDVVAILDALGIASASVCGLSIGGVTAQWLGIHASERLNKLVACNTAARLGSEQAWLERAQQVRSQGMAGIATGTPARWFTEHFAATHQELMGTAIGWVATTPAEGYAGCCEALAHADLREDIADINVSTLVIAGTEDPVTTVADGQFMVDRIATAALAKVPASHLSNLESPGEFNQALEHFLVG